MRSAILDAAEAEFAAHGFTGTGLRAIASRIGITQPLIHHYYGTKAALFDAVIERSYARYDLAQRDQWNRAPDDVRFFVEGLRILFAFVGQQRRLRHLMRWAQLEGRLPELPDGSHIDTKIVRGFRAAQAAGILRADIDVEVALLLIDGAVHGFWDRTETHPERFGDAPRLIEGLIEACLRAILSPTAWTEAQSLLAGGAANDGVPLSGRSRGDHDAGGADD
ncbi:MAG: TetR/AcrR family transcriptional regulator [Myxococcota bacterium]